MLPTLVAGSGTARSPIGNGMPALLRHPAQMQRLHGERHLLEPSVNVWRRCDGPFPLDGSVVRKDPQVCGRGLRTGKTAIVLLGVASRDPQAFGNSAELGIGRRAKDLLSFGCDIQRCLSAAPALPEARIALRGLLGRFPSISLATGSW